MRLLLAILLTLSAVAPVYAEVVNDEDSCDVVATMISVEVKNLYAVYSDKRAPGSDATLNLKNLTDTYDVMGCSASDLRAKIDNTIIQWRRHG